MAIAANDYTRTHRIQFPEVTRTVRRIVQRGWKQKPVDTSVALPFSKRDCSVMQLMYNPKYQLPVDVQNTYPDRALSGADEHDYVTVRNLARAKSYDRFVAKMHDTAELGITLATAGQAIDMITARAIQLRKGYSALRRGRFREFARTFGFRPLPKHKNTLRTRPRQASALWLEYWFGWSPLVADIHAAVDVLQGPYPEEYVSQTAKAEQQFLRTVNPPPNTTRERRSIVVSVKTSALITVENPNLYRANQLGLINPSVIAWDLVPFSFVIDWFLPVGAFLRSFSDFVGLKLRRPITTIKSWIKVQNSQEWRVSGRQIIVGMYDAMGFQMTRDLTISRPFEPPPLKLPSVNRAATAISLLTQLFIKP